MYRSQSRVLCLALVAVLVFGPVAGVAANPSAPTVTLSADIPTPDGQSGWWRTVPEVFASSDQDAVLHFDWGGAETTSAVTAGNLSSLGFAPQGESTVTAVAVNSAEETSDARWLRFKVDPDPPARPENLGASASAGTVSLAWDASADDVSGVAYYTVYRNLVGPPFSEGDAIGVVSDGTAYSDPNGAAGLWFYGVRAYDTAGNGSLLSDAVRVSADVTPPTVPGDLQAWLNGRGFVRVSWEASYDRESGVAGYVVTRTFPGQDATVVAEVPAGALYWDDTDLESVAAECEYSVYAVDRAGNASTVAGPVVRGVDTEAPSVPDEPVALGDLPLGGHSPHTIPVAFDLTWVESHDHEGSGIASYEVAYGPDAASPSWARTTDLTRLRVTSSAEWAHWWFAVRSEDRAGNVSDWTEPFEQRVATFDDTFGDDRVGTAVAASAETFGSATDVVIASSRSYPDGLAASTLAGVLHAPILLVGPGAVRSDVAAELTRLGAVNAWVVGGEPSVSAETFSALKGALSGEVTRVAGDDRYLTAAAVAHTARELSGHDPERVIVVSGQNYPDALSAGPIAYATGWPLVFAKSTDLPVASREVVASSGASATVILGSAASVWDGVEGLVPAPERLAGVDRYDTSARAAEWAVGHGVLSWARPVLVTGVNFPDGLSGGPFAGERGAPLLLSRTMSLPRPVKAALHAHGAEVRRMTTLGASLDTWSVYVDAWRAVQILPDWAVGL